MLRIMFSVLGLIVSGLYLANLGFGTAFEIPDLIPGIGNLDEFFFSGLFFYCLSQLGINLTPQRKPPQGIGQEKRRGA